MWRRSLFVVCGAVTLWPWEYAPQAALLLGIVLGLSNLTAYENEGKKLSRLLIQAAVVLLGLRLNLGEMLAELRQGGLLAIATVFSTLLVGLLLGRALRTERDVSLLVSAGTSICGGSAIAAVGSAIRASSSAIAVSTGAIFILNAVGLFVLPPLGRAMGLTPDQFGAWAGIALHDIASVGAAGRSFTMGGGGDGAAQTAMVVKLTRVVWITPIAIGAAHLWRSSGAGGKGKAPFPWFIIGFVAASGLVTLWPDLRQHVGPVMLVKDAAFQLALFLIGAGVSRAALSGVGWRALVQAVVLWVFIAAVSLMAVRQWV